MTFYDEQLHRKAMQYEMLQFNKVLMVDKNLSTSKYWMLIKSAIQSAILLAVNETKDAARDSFEATLTIIAVEFAAEDSQLLTLSLSSTVPNADTLAEIFTALDSFPIQFESESLPRTSSDGSTMDWYLFKKHLISTLQMLPRTSATTSFHATFMTNNKLRHIDVNILSEIEQFDLLTIAYFHGEQFSEQMEVCGLQHEFGAETTMYNPKKAKKIDEISIECIYSEVEAFCKKVFEDWICKIQIFQLSLPSSVFAKQHLTLNCQAKPRFISPLNLPQGFFLSKDLLAVRKSTIRKNLQTSWSQLKSICQIKLSGICQSLFCGLQVFVVSPKPIKSALGVSHSTAVSSVNEKNESLFRSLWKTLLRDNCGLLLIRNSGLENMAPLLNGHFFLIPVPNELFILQSIVTSELLLTSNEARLTKDTLDDEMTIMDVESSLAKLEILDEYDPLEYECNLYKSLQGKYMGKSKSPKNTTPKSSLNKRSAAKSRLSTSMQSSSKKTKYKPII